MREILFRGKRKDNGEWVEGNLFVPDKVTRLEAPTEILVGTNVVRISYEVDPETVGEYTGLTDKNGKRIFEGDIVRHHNNYPDSEIEEKGVVFWCEKYCGWRRSSNWAFHHGAVDTYRLSPDCLYEVIGNIHDNPELLEVQEK